MKITKSQLKQIIKEEISKVLSEEETGTLDPDHWLRQLVRSRAESIMEDENWKEIGASIEDMLFTSIDQYIHHSPALQDNPSATAENIIQAIVDEKYPKPKYKQLGQYTRAGYIGR